MLLKNVIYFDLDIKDVNKLCAICDSCGFEVDVVCGSIIVDGKSTMGVTQLCGRTVELHPITDSEYDKEIFFNKVKEMGAYRAE